MDNKITLTEKELAEALGLASATLWRLRKEGRISFVKIGKRVLYTEANIAAFLKQNEVTLTAHQ